MSQIQFSGKVMRHKSGRIVRMADSENIEIHEIGELKTNRLGNTYYWLSLRDASSGLIAMRSFIIGKHWIDLDKLRPLKDNPKEWLRAIGAMGLQLLIITPDEWLGDVTLDETQFLPNVIIRFEKEPLVAALQSSRRRKRRIGERGGAGPGWNPSWDAPASDFDATDDLPF